MVGEENMSREIFSITNTNGLVDYSEFFRHGLNYANAAYILRRKIDEEESGEGKKDINQFIPWITLESFGCELLLKSFLRKDEIEYKRTHDLYSLFLKMKEEDQDFVKKKTKEKYSDYLNQLDAAYSFTIYMDNINKSFDNWRYCIETNNHELYINIKFLSSFCESLITLFRIKENE